MILEETINKFIRDIINIILEAEGFAIKAKQQGNNKLGTPRPQGSYASVDFVTDITIGLEESSLENNTEDPDLTETITGTREIMMSVNFYRDSAIDNARSFRTGLIRSSIQELFKESNLGLIGRSIVREIDEPLENGWEERSQMDITLSAVGTDSDLIRSIESVNISAEYQARGLTYNYTIEV